jgi:hypothetical protein
VQEGPASAIWVDVSLDAESYGGQGGRMVVDDCGTWEKSNEEVGRRGLEQFVL